MRRRVMSDQFLNEIDAMLASDGPRREVTENMLLSPEKFTEPCARCHGTGTWRGVRRCFACKGSGKGRTYKTSPQARAAGRVRSAERRAKRAAKNEAEWRCDNADIAAWIDANPTFGFALSMLEAVRKYGALTEKQTAACHRCMATAAAREAAEAERRANAPAADVTALVASLRHARGKGLLRPRLRADSFEFSLAPDHGSNPGAVYVRERREYVGKILDGKFHGQRGFEGTTRLLEVLRDPEGATVRYGRMTGNCGCCGRALTNEESVARGIGPICAERFGW